MAKINICVVLQPRTRADGTHQIVMRINTKGGIKYFPVGYTVKKNDFDEKKQLVKKTDARHFEKNHAISNALSKAMSIENYFITKQIVPNIDSFTRRYQGTSLNQDSFFDFVEMHLQRNSREFTLATKDFYRKHISKLKGFAPTLTFADIDLDFLHSYKEHCYGLGNADSTMFKSLEFIRRVLNAAAKEDIIEKSPFRNFEIKNITGNTENLSIDEVKKLQALYDTNELPKAPQNVLRFFLFGCYTGLRYSDVYNLKFRNLIDKGGTLWLDFVQQKTGKAVLLPLIKQAIDLIPEKTFENAKMFRVVPNQTTNRHLRTIVEKLEWDKRITFHVARNTCSNLLYQLGAPIEVRSLVIGDTAQVLRKHYTNTDAEMVQKAMNDFSNSFKEKA